MAYNPYQGFCIGDFARGNPKCMFPACSAGLALYLLGTGPARQIQCRNYVTGEEPMRLAHHVIGFAVLVLVFLLGKLMVQDARRWSEALASRFASRENLGRFFVRAGRTVEVIAAIWGFLEAVAVMVLAT